MNSISELNAQQLRRAAVIQDKIASLEKELDAILGAAGPAPAAAKPSNGAARKRTMSAAARGRIAAAQKARWAKVKGKAPEAKPAPKQAKRQMSAAARAAISAAQKARWAKVKAEKK